MTESTIDSVFTGWETDGVLGSGAFGTVYLAHTMIEDKPVYNAIKVVRVPPSRESITAAEAMGVSRDLLKIYFDKVKSDLNWELTMSGTAQNKHLVRPEEFKTVDSEPAGWVGYIRYPVATPLLGYYEKVTSGSEDAARLGYEIAEALAVLAENNIAHGDVKPENILVADNGSFLLTDLAVKRTLEKAGNSLFKGQDNEYEAPELSSKERIYTPAGDIYSLGKLMEYVASDCGEGAEIAPELRTVIDACTAASPADRPSAAKVREMIEKSKLLGEKRTPRRAVAAVSAFDLVKKNGSTVRSVRGEEPFTPVEKIQFPNDEPKEKKSGKIAVKIASVAICAVAVIGVLALVIMNPFSKPADPSDTTPVVEPGKINEPSIIDDTPKTSDVTEPDEKTDAPSDNNENPGDNTDPDTPPENNGEPSTENPPVDNPPVDNPPEVDPPVEEAAYLFPSDTKLMTEADVEGKNRSESYMLINELYARHGLTFKTASIREHFESQSWYKPDSSKTASQIEREFNEIEKANLKLLTEYQKEMGYR
ncbi:MAG: YARHG domain-containing protein [Oscillospiraceae bacterium]|nr:YARHG domain-containing protein [Oscillospiraceae bacterium]